VDRGADGGIIGDNAYGICTYPGQEVNVTGFGLLALQHICTVMNCAAEKLLGNCPPQETLHGQTLDIKILLFFLFWGIACICRVEDDHSGTTHAGRYLSNVECPDDLS